MAIQRTLTRLSAVAVMTAGLGMASVPAADAGVLLCTGDFLRTGDLTTYADHCVSNVVGLCTHNYDPLSGLVVDPTIRYADCLI